MHAWKLAVLAACLFAVSSSMAAPFPNSGKTIATGRVATGSGVVPYQAVSSKEKCLSPTICTITFPAITDSGVFIQHVSCVFEIETGGNAAVAEIAIDGQSGFNMLNTSKLTSESGGFLYDANGQTDLFVDTGQRPEALVAATSKKITNMACTISGFHV